MAFPPFQARPLDPTDSDRAMALAGDMEVNGVYVANYLAQHPLLDGGASLVALHGMDDLEGLIYCGGRGNLLVLLRRELDSVAVTRAVREHTWDWRIVLGPPAVVTELTNHERLRPLVHRNQVFYSIRPEDVPRELVRDDVRPAQKEDLKLLATATIDLNELDLGVPAWRISKEWVRRNVRQRQKDGSTLLVGPPGRPFAKLDIGSAGPAGTVLEGVYTWLDFRGQGHATGLVATAAARADAGTMVCLHVAEDNAAARRAYEKAGMEHGGQCALMLRG